MRISDGSSDVCSSDLCGFTQASGHGLVAFGDQGVVQCGTVLRELAEARLQHVALLELLDLGLADLVVDEQPRQQSADEPDPAEKTQPGGDPLEGDTDIAVDQVHRQAACARVVGSGLQFRSEEHTSELQSLMRISYAVFCLKKKTN